ncbi:uncharacterized protein LOC141631533 [Silene latifolia]|uniref:uncharacterized protein LOC141631533 n=1 Tax=Silene latifolia TaxID=37657 RepID=UPI003D787552
MHYAVGIGAGIAEEVVIALVVTRNYTANLWQGTSRGYSVSSDYEVIRRRFREVNRHEHVWNVWGLPEQQFIEWLIAREALQMKVKLFNFGCCNDALCLLCGSADETHYHVFQKCEYSSKILSRVAYLCGVQVPARNAVSWVYNRQFTKLQKGVIGSAFMAAHYAIWMQRNKVVKALFVLNGSSYISPKRKRKKRICIGISVELVDY